MRDWKLRIQGKGLYPNNKKANRSKREKKKRIAFLMGRFGVASGHPTGLVAAHPGR